MTSDSLDNLWYNWHCISYQWYDIFVFCVNLFREADCIKHNCTIWLSERFIMRWKHNAKTTSNHASMLESLCPAMNFLPPILSTFKRVFPPQIFFLYDLVRAATTLRVVYRVSASLPTLSYYSSSLPLQTLLLLSETSKWHLYKESSQERRSSTL